MTGFTAINLSQLPVAPILPDLTLEDIIALLKADIVAGAPELESVLALESEPIVKLIEAAAYRIGVLRQEVVDASKDNMLAYSAGPALDNLAALLGVLRLVAQEADPDALPPTEAVMESDERLRTRCQLALEGFSTAGPEGAYIFWALSASASIKDASVSSPQFDHFDPGSAIRDQLPQDVIYVRVTDPVGLAEPLPGDVAVTVLSAEGDGTPTQADLDAVAEILASEDVRPLTDRPRVAPAEILTYDVVADLTLYAGPDAEVVRSAAETALLNYVTDHHRLGHDITVSGLHGALHQPGVQKVQLISPTSEIVVDYNQAAFCTSIDVSVGGRGV